MSERASARAQRRPRSPSPSPPNPASTPVPLIQIKSFQTQISIIHLIQIMPCDKNYPYCNNPLNWERAAHQKERGEKKGAGSEGRWWLWWCEGGWGGGRRGGGLSSSLESGPSQLEFLPPRCLRRSFAKRGGMTKLKQIERKPGRTLPQSITPGLN